MRLCHLMLELSSWKDRSVKYARLLQERQHQFDALRLEFDIISSRLGNYERQLADARSESEGPSLKILEDMERQLMGAVENHYKKVCTFTARGVFAIELGINLDAQALVVHYLLAVAHRDLYRTGIKSCSALIHRGPPKFPIYIRRLAGITPESNQT